MFIQTHYLNTPDDTVLSFVKSLAVLAYPCGRRRGQTNLETEFIPFDPEARLNTEANARKYSGLNGYTQSYILDWSDESKKAIIVVGGYYFEITLEALFSNADVDSADAFGAALIDAQKDFIDSTGADKIYANIHLKQVPLFVDGTRDLRYNTNVLKNQTNADSSSAIDVLADGVDRTTATYEDDNYYFSGLSFSVTPKTDHNTDENCTYVKKVLNTASSITDITRIDRGTPIQEQVLSLQILEKQGSTWQIFKPALLPKIEHGDIDNSVKMSTVYANDIILNTKPVPALTKIPMLEGEAVKDITKLSPEELEQVKYRLRFDF